MKCSFSVFGRSARKRCVYNKDMDVYTEENKMKSEKDKKNRRKREVSVQQKWWWQRSQIKIIIFSCLSVSWNTKKKKDNVCKNYAWAQKNHNIMKLTQHTWNLQNEHKLLSSIYCVAKGSLMPKFYFTLQSGSGCHIASLLNRYLYPTKHWRIDIDNRIEKW